MARSDAAWGIDIGNASLKALRLRPGEQPDRVIADAFDYIEYPMLLTQPAADRATLVETALQQFLSRNDVRGDRVAIAVPGQAGLARFIKLPPVEARKIPDIVRYEAKQQIPYDLDSVVWRFQRMDAEETGDSRLAFEPEIGLFALKRDQVITALEPFQEVGVEVDIIQLTPLALYNYARFDELTDLPPPDEYDPDNPPPSIAIISIGTDSTDLVVTSGFRVWQRNIPIGGSNFTKALSKELKLTFSKAEHLKKNISTASDAKQVFQAMRPVFGELLSQVQHSLGYYTTIDRAAKVESALVLGATIKLPGLRRFLEQGLGFPVKQIQQFSALEGPEVLASPVFQENLISFGVSYGLALQGVDLGAMQINMVPDEIVKERMVKAKKPWAVAAAATLLMGCAISFAGQSLALSRVSPEVFGSAEQQAQAVVEEAKRYQSALSTVEQEFDSIDEIGQNLTENVEGRLLWLELLAAINQCLPSDPPGQVPEAIEQRNQIFIDSLNSQKISELENWFTLVGEWYRPLPGMPQQSAGSQGASAGTAGTSTAATGSSTGTATGAADSGVGGPSGEGYIIQITGHHFHNSPEEKRNFGAEYVQNTLIRNLELASVQLGNEVVTLKELGVSYPCLINPGRVEEILVPDPNVPISTGAPGEQPEGADQPGTTAEPGAAAQPPAASATGTQAASPPQAGTTTAPAGSLPATAGQPGQPGRQQARNMISLRRFQFVVQFAWQPTTPSERREARLEAVEGSEDADGTMSAEQPRLPGTPDAGGVQTPGTGPMPGDVPAGPAPPEDTPPGVGPAGPGQRAPQAGPAPQAGQPGAGQPIGPQPPGPVPPPQGRPGAPVPPGGAAPPPQGQPGGAGPLPEGPMAPPGPLPDGPVAPDEPLPEGPVPPQPGPPGTPQGQPPQGGAPGPGPNAQQP